MPILEVFAPFRAPSPALLDDLTEAARRALDVPRERVWIVWHALPDGAHRRPEWEAGSRGPLVLAHCRADHGEERTRAMVAAVARALAEGVGCALADVYVAAQPLDPSTIHARGALLAESPSSNGAHVATPAELRVRPVGTVRNRRPHPEDDHWGDVVSVIELDAEQFGPSAVAGLRDFSHLEVVFHFHRVRPDEIERGSRHPRERLDWPLVGVFAQRGKARPNRIGVSRCHLLGVKGLVLSVQGLDAIDGTPVLDVKPYMAEFGPIGPVVQPAWATRLMEAYYADGSAPDAPGGGRT